MAQQTTGDELLGLAHVSKRKPSMHPMDILDNLGNDCRQFEV